MSKNKNLSAEEKFKAVISHSKEYGFIFQSSEIYDGLSAVYDYGQCGSQLKNNLREYWWRSMVQLNENIVGIDSAVFMHPTTWKASGHIDAFNDPLIDNKDSKKRYRADVLVEEYIGKIESKADKEVEKARKRFGDSFDEYLFRKTNPRVVESERKKEEINLRLKNALEQNDLAALRQLILDLEIVCPVSGTRNWTEVRQFNLMFSTQLGSLSDDAQTIYLRPETAQGIFVNFLNVYKTGRMKIPFGIAQTGKAFRNEIVARQFIFRMREFEQMEMQFFIRPGTEIQWYNYWKEKRIQWHYAMGFSKIKYRFHDHIKLAHYANVACDIEFEFPFGFKELEGIHSRTDFDLKNHENQSGKRLQYFDPDMNESYIPYVIETSIGLDRLFLAVMSESYCEEQLEDGSERTVLRIPPALAPVKCAVLPLVNKDALPEKSREIMKNIKLDFDCMFDAKDSIGKRYRRQDAIGTPYCLTIDHQTLEDNTLTIRERDSMTQERIALEEVSRIIEDRVSLKKLLKLII
ncbi:MAG: glycine--tRNA ligase [Bacteroidia bacterium]|nr:glycine--tRNA ligase [Bacteroidia bacterium]MCZ2277946.1 glycine--tRNA ligase [Bacteroidia bacterium]